MKAKLFFSGLLIASTFSATSVLASDKAPGSGPNPYSDCGIGAALFTNTKWAAVSSNVIWDLGTTAVTSATASPETCNGKEAQAAAFIYESHDQLVEETARGSGQYLATLLNILDIQEQDRSAVADSIRLHLAHVVVTEAYTQADKLEKARRYYDSVMASL